MDNSIGLAELAPDITRDDLGAVISEKIGTACSINFSASSFTPEETGQAHKIICSPLFPAA